MDAQPFSTAPVDVLASVLSFVAPRDLARFAGVNNFYRGAATHDRLWGHWLATHFADLRQSWDTWGYRPVTQYRALAVAPCARCGDSLLQYMEPRVAHILCANTRKGHNRFPGPHSCELCGRLFCATHGCSCTCLLGPECQDVGAFLDGESCHRCTAWLHYACGRMEFCRVCDLPFCDGCMQPLPRAI